MRTITDVFLVKMLSTAKSYCLVILKAGVNRNEPGVDRLFENTVNVISPFVQMSLCPLSARSQMEPVA
jgi:hypothetical protein